MFHQREPSARYAGMGNITAQLELKKSLECKSFDWFINNVAYDMLEKVHRLLCHILKWYTYNKNLFGLISSEYADVLIKDSQYPKLPPNVQLGSLVNVGSRSCLDTMGR